ncbi:recombination protein O N-terminal domain-containing protein [Candidatus Parcubacteria bacterium]|nr:recombination protein O N-terminal domain-containing protein [Candidatus Parcubacteria bacterium]
MVYTIYETNCIIFDIRNIQENDVLIKAFSDKFGVISIIATSFRKETSKLKGNIKAFSVNKIAVVRGKEFFRLTDVHHKFLFAGSKSLVQFLRIAEGLFFNDERDYFEDVNTEIYDMIIHLCKFIIYTVKGGKDNKRHVLDTITVFFTVYIRGLQGFTDKINNLNEMLSLEGEELSVWFETKMIDVHNSNKKLSF